MKNRFTLRDLVWLLIVVGLAVALGVEHTWRVRLDNQNAELREQAADCQQRLEKVRSEYALLKLVANNSGVAPLDVNAMEIAQPGEWKPTAIFVPDKEK